MATYFGDIMRVKRGIVVHGCNAQSVMGSGIAQTIRSKYPQVFEDYRNALRGFDSHNNLGRVVTTQVGDELYIYSAITQEFYGRNPDVKYVSYDAMDRAFETIALLATPQPRIQSLPIYYPKIGSGLANGNWNVIQEIINHRLDKLEHHLVIYSDGTNYVADQFILDV